MESFDPMAREMTDPEATVPGRTATDALSLVGQSPAGELARISWVSGSIAIGLVLLGTAFRVLRYSANRPLWLDEAALAINLRNRSFLGLTQPLDWGQGAPIGFLWIEKLVVIIAGPSELAMRFVPLVAGILALPFFFLLCRRLFGTLTANVALALFAIAEAFIYYSSEVKQYSTDSLIAICLVLTCLEAARSGRVACFWGLGLGGIFAIFFSHPAIFVLGSIVLYLFILGRSTRRELTWPSVILALVWGLFTLINYALFLRGLLKAEQGLVDANAYGFTPFPPHDVNDLKWYFSNFLYTFKFIFSHPSGVGEPIGVGIPISGLAAALAVIGAVSIAHEQKPTLILLLGPLILVLIAAALRKYPYIGRLILFLMPLIIMLIAAGITAPEHGSTREKLRLDRIVMFTILILFPFLAALNGVLKPPISEDVRPVLAYMNTHQKPGDLVYLYGGSSKAWSFYAPTFGLNEITPIEGEKNIIKASDRPNNILRLKGKKRVWFLFSFLSDRRGTTNEEELTLSFLNSLGKQIDHISADGASGYLYDFSDPNP